MEDTYYGAAAKFLSHSQTRFHPASPSSKWRHSASPAYSRVLPSTCDLLSPPRVARTSVTFCHLLWELLPWVTLLPWSPGLVCLPSQVSPTSSLSPTEPSVPAEHQVRLGLNWLLAPSTCKAHQEGDCWRAHIHQHFATGVTELRPVPDHRGMLGEGPGPWDPFLF